MSDTPHRSLSLLLALVLGPTWLPACGSGGGGSEPGGIASREQGWLRGDLHVHTNVQGGFETLASVIALAEGLASPEFLWMNPAYEGNHLDYLAITDHDSVAALSDPDFRSAQLVLVGGEEWSGDGHAGCLGIRELVVKDPGGDGKSQADVDAALAHTHAQGGLMSINHPMLQGNPFLWGPRGMDGLEVWNSGFGIGDPALTQADIDAWELENGPASPFARRAAQLQGGLCSRQNLILYEALLARGEHVALVGGSDRHAFLMPGFPATYSQAPSADLAGVLAGIRARHTFVSRTPAAAQVLLEVERGGESYGLGDEIPVAAAGEELEVVVRVGRAEGGLVRLIAGEAVGSDEELATAELGRVALEEAVTADPFIARVRLQARPGTWFYPVVLEPLVAPGLDPAEAAHVRDIARQVAATGAEEFTALGQIMLPYVDTAVLVDSSLCNPRSWSPDEMQCMPQDPDGLATFYLPDFLDRTLNVVLEDGEITDWCMGALGSAALCVAE